MISGNAFDAIKERAVKILVSRGYEPAERSFLSDYIPLHLVGCRNSYEILCVKIRVAGGAVSTSYVESFCRFEICQFRSLLIMSPGSVFLRCEVWVISQNESIHCFEVTPDNLCEVAAYA